MVTGPVDGDGLAHRARTRVRVAGSVDVTELDVRAGRRVVDAFFAAARAGNFDALVALLDPQIDLRVDGPATVPSTSSAAQTPPSAP